MVFKNKNDEFRSILAHRRRKSEEEKKKQKNKKKRKSEEIGMFSRRPTILLFGKTELSSLT